MTTPALSDTSATRSAARLGPGRLTDRLKMCGNHAPGGDAFAELFAMIGSANASPPPTIAPPKPAAGGDVLTAGDQSASQSDRTDEEDDSTSSKADDLVTDQPVAQPAAVAPPGSQAPAAQDAGSGVIELDEAASSPDDASDRAELHAIASAIEIRTDEALKSTAEDLSETAITTRAVAGSGTSVATAADSRQAGAAKPRVATDTVEPEGQSPGEIAGVVEKADGAGRAGSTPDDPAGSDRRDRRRSTATRRPDDNATGRSGGRPVGDPPPAAGPVGAPATELAASASASAAPAPQDSTTPTATTPTAAAAGRTGTPPVVPAAPPSAAVAVTTPASSPTPTPAGLTPARSAPAKLAPPPAAAGSKTPGAAAGSTLQQAKLIQRVSRGFQHLGRGEGSIRMRLSPASLGSVRLELRVSGDGLVGQISADSAIAAADLAEGLPALRQSLAAQGITVSKIEVVHAPELAGDAGPSWSRGEADGQPSTPGDRRRQNGEPSRASAGGQRSAPEPVSGPTTAIDGWEF